MASTQTLRGTVVATEGFSTTGALTAGDSATGDAHSITGALALSGLITGTIQTITVADNTTLIATGTAGANQALLAQNLIAANNTAGASKNLTLPAASAWSGKLLLIINVSANDVVVKDSGATTLATLTAGKGVIVMSNGSGVGRIVGA